MTIGFNIWEDGGVFAYPDAHSEVAGVFDDILDARDDGKLSAPHYDARLQELVAENPDFIDGHAHHGYALFDRGKFKLALEACLCGVLVGEHAIPSGFSGLIEWGHLENRPFLRAMHGVVLCHLRFGQRQKALPLMEQMLAWNPDDNQGIRYLIGSEYLRAGKTGKARTFLTANADHYPPCRYDLALLQFRQGKHVAAATTLRHAFAANGYVAEILCGTPDPAPITIWHGSNHAEPEIARDYTTQYGKLWSETPGAIAFLRWLHTHPKVMAERAAFLEGREALLWERDVEARGQILTREQTILQEMDDRLSTLIVRPRADRGDSTVLPWLYAEKHMRV